MLMVQCTIGIATGEMNGQPTPTFLEEVRQHFELENREKHRRIRSTQVESKQLHATDYVRRTQNLNWRI